MNRAVLLYSRHRSEQIRIDSASREAYASRDGSTARSSASVLGRHGGE